MAYKVENVYKDSNIMDLNLMEIHEYKRTHISPLGILLTLSPLIVFGFTVFMTVMPEMSFMAECMNVGNGDICHIALQ